VKVVDPGRVVWLSPFVLLAKDHRGRPALTGEEKQQVVLKVIEGLGAEVKELPLDAVVVRAPVAGDPSSCGDELVPRVDQLLKKAAAPTERSRIAFFCRFI
jgi:hypothetical protein